MSHPDAPSSRTRRVLPWLALSVGLLGILYACSGAFMAGSFGTADGTPTGRAYWWRIALIYEIIAGACLVVCVAGTTVLIRRGRRGMLNETCPGPDTIDVV
ncbi:hypothetical protein [Longimicrobium sp.]|jgi:aromatic ring hydroxylase|uniref:hypothetical protein n=1 Tax=Longimicrobium sp. TaxID=2029185 RepID=UPI002ED96DA5